MLIAGLARSGTTWLGQALSAAEGTAFLDEPDNHYRYPLAFRLKAGLPGRAYPLLNPGDAAPGYAALWESAFGLVDEGGVAARTRGAAATALHRGVLPRRLRRGQRLVRRSYADRGGIALRLALASRLALPETPPQDARDVVVKSVYAARSSEWLAELLPLRVLILKRDLHGVIASWKAIGWLSDPDEDFLDELGPGAERTLREDTGAPAMDRALSHVGRVAWLLACMATELRTAAARHPEWTVASYEDLVGDASGLIPTLATGLGLGWSAEADAVLRGPLAPPRRPPGIDPRLSAAEVEEIDAVLSGFELRGWAW